MLLVFHSFFNIVIDLSFFFAFRILVKIHVHADDKLWKNRGIVILKYTTNIQ